MAISIVPQSAHGVAMDRAVTVSFWGLGMLISAGIVLAFLVW